MIKKIIIFGDFKAGRSVPLKSAAVLRLAYALRQKEYNVKQVHHCTEFSYNELKKIIMDFSAGDKICVCVSTSFLSDADRKNVNLSESVKDSLGIGWGTKSFLFLFNIGKICKELNFPYLLGGWEINKKKITEKDDVWGFDKLASFVTYFVQGKDINIIEDVCNEREIKYQLIHEKKKLAKTNEVLDFSDCASTPSPDDDISQGESISTEVAAGCIFSCSFCNYAALGKKKNEYTRTYDSFEREIVENYKNFKTELYTLTDNIVNDTPEKIRYLIDVRERNGIDFKWVGYARLDTIQTKEQARLLKESGMIGAAFGIESLYKPTGRYIGKVTDKDRIVKSLELLRNEIGDEAIFTGLFIAGLPEESVDHMLQTYAWLNSIEGRYLLDHYSYSAFVIYENNDNKNDINKSRNNPFRDYVVDYKTKYWTSPWSSYEEVLGLARKFTVKRMNKTGGAFSLPFISNSGYDLKKLMRDIRDCGKQGVPFLHNNSFGADEFITNYKKKLLDG